MSKTKTWGKKALALLLTVVMAFAIMPLTATPVFADDPISAITVYLAAPVTGVPGTEAETDDVEDYIAFSTSWSPTLDDGYFEGEENYTAAVVLNTTGDLEFDELFDEAGVTILPGDDGPVVTAAVPSQSGGASGPFDTLTITVEYPKTDEKIGTVSVNLTPPVTGVVSGSATVDSSAGYIVKATGGTVWSPALNSKGHSPKRTSQCSHQAVALT